MSGSPFQLVEKQGAYLAALERLEAQRQTAATAEEHSRYAQSLAWAYAFVGECDVALRTVDQGLRDAETMPYNFPVALPEAIQAREAISEIVKASYRRQAVIINETHYVGQHRAFAALLALALRKEGFNYLAAETFAPTIAETERLGYPNRRTGSFTADPLYGDLVRQALRVGYQLIAYEAEEDGHGACGRDGREIGQARNLHERIFKRDPSARALIYVGGNHGMKSVQRFGEYEKTWMAAHLQPLTGIDPLSIDQTDGMEAVDPETENVAYTLIDRRFRMRRPRVVRLPDGRFWITGNYTGTVDIQVFHPRTRRKHGRPDWLAMGGYRTPFTVPQTWMPDTGRLLLQAFVAQEGADAIPMDQVLLTAGQPKPALMLPQGEYRIQVQDRSGASRPLMTLTHS